MSYVDEYSDTPWLRPGAEYQGWGNPYASWWGGTGVTQAQRDAAAQSIAERGGPIYTPENVGMSIEEILAIQNGAQDIYTAPTTQGGTVYDQINPDGSGGIAGNPSPTQPTSGSHYDYGVPRPPTQQDRDIVEAMRSQYGYNPYAGQQMNPYYNAPPPPLVDQMGRPLSMPDFFNAMFYGYQHDPNRAVETAYLPDQFGNIQAGGTYFYGAQPLTQTYIPQDDLRMLDQLLAQSGKGGGYQSYAPDMGEAVSVNSDMFGGQTNVQSAAIPGKGGYTTTDPRYGPGGKGGGKGGY